MSDYATYSPILNYGTRMMTFSLEIALAQAGAMGENTTLGVLAKALTYWQNVAATSSDGNLVANANLAVGWIQTEQVRVQSPPASILPIIEPV